MTTSTRAKRHHRIAVVNRGRIDWIGILCLVVALGAGEIVLERGERSDWFQAPWVCYSSLFALSALGLLIYNELRVHGPDSRFNDSGRPPLHPTRIWEEGGLSTHWSSKVFAAPRFSWRHLATAVTLMAMVILSSFATVQSDAVMSVAHIGPAHLIEFIASKNDGNSAHPNTRSFVALFSPRAVSM